MTNRVANSVLAAAGYWLSIGRRASYGAAVALLIGCSSVPIAPGVANAQPTMSDDDSQLLYELLVSELAIRRGELGIAAEGYLRATERTDDPRVAERATQLAVYYQQWDTAERTATRWLSLDPQAVGAYEALAQIQLRTGEQAAAVAALAGWLTATDNAPETFTAINQLLQRDSDMDLAYRVADSLAVDYPDQAIMQVGKARLALGVNRRQEALSAANAALKLDGNLVDAFLVKAQAQISQGQSPEAIITLQNAVTQQPDSLSLHMGFAQLLVESGLHDRAGPILSRAGELSVGDADTWLRLGLLALNARRNEQAKTYLSGVLEADPYNERAHFYLGRIADQQRDNEAAIGHYDAVPQGEFFLTAAIRAAELAAQSGETQAGLGRLRSLSSLSAEPGVKVQIISAESRILQDADKREEALAVLTGGLESYPKNTELLYARALAAESLGDNSRFENDLLKLLDIEPDNAHALNALGYHFAVQNIRLDEAQIHLERANTLEPDDAAIMDSLGWLRFRQGRLEEAKELLSEAYGLFPDAEIAAHLGEVLWVLGDQQAAQALWNKALADAPEHKILNAVVERLVD